MRTLFFLVMFIPVFSFSAELPTDFATGIKIYRHNQYWAVNFGTRCYATEDWQAELTNAIPNDSGTSIELALISLMIPRPNFVQHEWYSALCYGEQLWRVAKWGNSETRPVKIKVVDDNGNVTYRSTTEKVAVGTRCHGKPLGSDITTQEPMALLPPYKGLYAECEWIKDKIIEEEIQALKNP